MFFVVTISLCLTYSHKKSRHKDITPRAALHYGIVTPQFQELLSQYFLPYFSSCCMLCIRSNTNLLFLQIHTSSVLKQYWREWLQFGLDHIYAAQSPLPVADR